MPGPLQSIHTETETEKCEKRNQCIPIQLQLLGKESIHIFKSIPLTSWYRCERTSHFSSLVSVRCISLGAPHTHVAKFCHHWCTYVSKASHHDGAVEPVISQDFRGKKRGCNHRLQGFRALLPLVPAVPKTCIAPSHWKNLFQPMLNNAFVNALFLPTMILNYNFRDMHVALS